MTLIIAEAGVNHNGDIHTAYKLIEEAAKAGADIVKFQTFKANMLAVPTASKADYQQITTSQNESQLSMLRKLELQQYIHPLLINHCKKFRIEFLSTAFDHSSIHFLSTLNLGRWKIPSGEITNLPYLRHIAKFKQPVILSTGMSTLPEVEKALNILFECGLSHAQITLLHCTTEYPAPFDEVNLYAMQTMREFFNLDVGYSDHTQGITVPIAAVALGASTIEKHFTLDRSMEGPDHAASLDPNEFKSMVDGIREIELALGDGFKKPSQSETKNLSVIRKSIVAASGIDKGQLFTEHNLTTKRPGNGISPMDWDLVLGTFASRDYNRDDLIQW